MLWELKPTVLDRCEVPLEGYKLSHTGLAIQISKLGFHNKECTKSAMIMVVLAKMMLVMMMVTMMMMMMVMMMMMMSSSSW